MKTHEETMAEVERILEQLKPLIAELPDFYEVFITLPILSWMEKFIHLWDIKWLLRPQKPL